MSGSWTIPTDEEVERTLALLTDANLRSTFFSELENPEWLAALQRLDVFVPAPGNWVDPQGVERPLPWSEGDYLARIAPVHPEEVTAILLVHGASDNPWVQRAIINAAAALPADSARRLVPSLVRTIKSQSGWLDVPKLVSIAAHLSEAGHVRPTRTLLSALFEPGAIEDEAYAGLPRDLVTRVDDHLYAISLPRAVPLLVALDGISGLKLLGGWLMNSRPQLTDDSEPPYDPASIWRPSIATHPQNLGMHAPTDALISAVRDAALALGRAGQFIEVIDFLNGSRLFLLRRIGLEVAAEVLTEASPPEWIAFAATLATDPVLLDITARPEYVHLVRTLLPLLDEAQRDEWTRFVESDDWTGPEERIRRMAAWRTGDLESVANQDIALMRDHLRHRLLQPLAGVLPEPLAVELERLHGQFGDIPHPEFSSYMESFTGPTSPREAGELMQMTAWELSTYLRAWEPPNVASFGPSIEGLARQVEILAKDAPRLVAELAPELPEIGRSYVRAAFNGWAKAIPGGYQPSGAVWSLVEVVVAMSDDGSEGGSIDFDSHDRTWRYSQRAALDLIAAHIQAIAVLSDAEVERLWRLLEPLTDHPDPARERPASSANSDMDPMTASLNELRPHALRVAIQLAAKSHSGDSGNPTRAESRILDAVARHVGIGRDPTLSVAAVIGEGIGRLWSVDPSWVVEHGDTLFALVDPDPEQRSWSDVAVSVAVRSYQTGAAFVRLIRPALSSMFTREYLALDHTDGWRDPRSVVEATAMHLLRAYVAELIELDDPDMQRLFGDEVPTELKAEILGTLGWQLMHWNTNENPAPPSVFARARTLIDWRVGLIGSAADVSELAKFFWWARSGAFSPTWWLPILKLAVNSEVEETSGMLSEPLAEAVKLEPGLTLDVLDQLLSISMEQWHRYDLLRSSGVILATAMRIGDKDVVAHARQMLDRLGREGHLALLKEIDERMAQ